MLHEHATLVDGAKAGAQEGTHVPTASHDLFTAAVPSTPIIRHTAMRLCLI